MGGGNINTKEHPRMSVLTLFGSKPRLYFFWTSSNISPNSDPVNALAADKPTNRASFPLSFFPPSPSACPLNWAHKIQDEILKFLWYYCFNISTSTNLFKSCKFLAFSRTAAYFKRSILTIHFFWQFALELLTFKWYDVPFFLICITMRTNSAIVFNAHICGLHTSMRPYF